MMRYPDLATLEEQVRWEIAAFGPPSVPWAKQHTDEHGKPLLDVLVIGGGQSGLCTAFRLMREGVSNLLVVDKAPAGREGPWVTWARMETLRTLKELHGTEVGIRSASFRVWFDTTRGPGAFDALKLIDRVDWMDYLIWLRKVSGVPVRNDTAVTSLEPHGGFWKATMTTPDGEQVVVARHVVAATGMISLGGPRFPEFLAQLGGEHAVHSSAMIDFDRLRGKRVAVIGIAASAFDNAGTALESGAGSVRMFGRRPDLGLANADLGKYFGKVGLLKGYSYLADDVRVDYSRTEFDGAMPAPEHSVQRCTTHENFSLELGVALDRAQVRDGVVVLSDGEREWEADFVIAATGFQMDMRGNELLAPYVDDILTWGDVVELGGTKADRIIARHPYLGPGMAVQRKSDSSPEALSRLHLYSPAAFVSFGLAAHGAGGLPWSIEAIASAVIGGLARDDGRYMIEGFVVRDPAPAGA